MTKAVLQLRIRFTDGGPEYAAEMALDRAAVESCVSAAARRPDAGWRAVESYTLTWVSRRLLEWAERTMPHKVDKAREPHQFAEMLMSNLRRQGGAE